MRTLFIKGRSAYKINQLLNQKGVIWQRSFYDRRLREDETIYDTANYILDNPIHAGLVDNLADYPLWGVDYSQWM